MNFDTFLNKYDIYIFFQPIISTVQKKTIGFEALTRAQTKEGINIPPLELFAQAKAENLIFSFDKYVRAKAIQKFMPYYEEDDSLLLFLNFESSLIDQNISFEAFDISAICTEANIATSNIVIEIKEDEISKTELLKEFCAHYRQLGFNIALDDFGVGSSTFDRLSVVKPDIVKIDISIIKNINKNFINSEILKAITKMCYKIGAVVLAEGVETKEEILKCKKSDISIYQGYYFGKPKYQVKDAESATQEKIDNIILKHSKMLQQYKNKKEQLIDHSIEYSHHVIKSLSQFNITDLSNKKLQSFMENEQKLEALYIIDYDNAKQIGETIINGKIKKFYSPAIHGDCHYLKDYYYITKNSKEQTYLSQKYISKATGNICRTFAKKFNTKEQNYILCLDMKI